MKKTIRDFKLNNKKVIIRCDFNVPIKDGKIIDDTRIKNSLKTIQYAIDKNAKVILLSHLGRIKEDQDKIKNNLKIVADRLSDLLAKKVIFQWKLLLPAKAQAVLPFSLSTAASSRLTTKQALKKYRVKL